MIYRRSHWSYCIQNLFLRTFDKNFINDKRQILELNEKLETMQSEKTQLVVQLNSKQPDSNTGKKTTPQKNKIADQRRLKIKELEAQMANLQKYVIS